MLMLGKYMEDTGRCLLLILNPSRLIKIMFQPVFSQFFMYIIGLRGLSHFYVVPFINSHISYAERSLFSPLPYNTLIIFASSGSHEWNFSTGRNRRNYQQFHKNILILNTKSVVDVYHTSSFS